MDTLFRCKNERRRDAVEDQTAFNGIDYLEVASADQKTLEVHFIHPLPEEPGQVPPSPAPALTVDNVRIEGGVQVQDVPVVAVSTSNEILTVTVDEAGDYSTYTLRLITSPTQPTPPPGFDPPLSSVDFSFKVECPSDFDCKQEPVCPPEQFDEPEIDYLAKDYNSFRRLMLDRMSIIMPDWRERNAADVQIALVELLAYVGDHLSYYQDAVATEAYLGTARRRISVRRHARLLDYFVHNGCNARTWMYFEVDGREEVRAGTPVQTPGSDVVFETMHDATLRSEHNAIEFYTWSDEECCLPRGSTRATLRYDHTVPLAVLPESERLQAGDVLIFEEVRSPTKGTVADADPKHRQAVRLTKVTFSEDNLDNTPLAEIEWHEADALRFPLCLTALVATPGGTPEVQEVSVARGNIVLADHGRTPDDPTLDPDLVPERGSYRPRLRDTDITFTVAYNHDEAQQHAATATLQQDPRQALPAVMLEDEDELWQPQRDLLSSDRFKADFVVEVERDGSAHVRFGDDTLGKAPSAGSSFTATYRVGNGRAGNVGRDAITEIAPGFPQVAHVRNPLAADGGTNRESMEEVRQFAPQAFRTQERAVTTADWAEVAERFSSVQKAVACFRWTGSWYTVFITIDRTSGLSVEEDTFAREIRAHLERFRIAGYDLKINDPVFVPLDLLLSVCVKTGYFRSHVEQTLLTVFSRHDLADGRRGFFHPDNFTFGQPVYLSRIYQAAMAVDGVDSVEVMRFRRWGKKPNQERENGLLTTAALEVARLDNDPSQQENGKIEFEMIGGL